MDRARQRLSIAVIGLFTLMLAATSKQPKADGDEGTSATPSKNGTDIDFDAVRKAARCAGKTTPGCTLLDEFAGAMPYDPPAEEVVWYGESFGLGGATEAREPFFVQISEAGGGARSLVPENAKERADATSLLAATKAGNAVPNSEAAKFMRNAAVPGGKKPLVKTGGRSLSFQEFPQKVYMRKSGTKLLVLEYTGATLGHDRAGGVSAIAWIAETWLLR